MSINIANRLVRLRQTLADKELDGIFISQPENRFYLSGFYGSAGYLLVTAKDAVLATDFRYVEQAGKEAPDYRVFKIAGELGKWFPELTGDLNLHKIGFEAGDVTFSLYRKVSDVLKETHSPFQLIPTEGLVESLRMIKEPGEIDLISRAAEISDKAMQHAENILRRGMTEIELAWEIEKFMRENGSQAIPFDVIVASGPNAALPHASPSQRQIDTSEPVVIDIGARVGFYASDLTRTVCFGAPDDRFKKIYDIVLGAQLTAMALIREHMSGSEADSLARVVIEEAGYGEAFGHALGHGVGLAVHEEPRLGPESKDNLTSGMVFSVEPGIYLPEWGGVRIEDLVVMENGKIKTLSKAKK